MKATVNLTGSCEVDSGLEGSALQEEQAVAVKIGGSGR